MQHSHIPVIRTYVSSSRIQLEESADLSPSVAQINNLFIPHKTGQCILSSLSFLPFLRVCGDRWTHVVPPPRAPPHLEPATSVLAHASADRPQAAPPPSASCQRARDVYAEGTYVLIQITFQLIYAASQTSVLHSYLLSATRL